MKRGLAVLTVVVLAAATVAPVAAGGSAEFPQGVAARSRVWTVRLWSRATESGSYSYEVATDRRFRVVAAAGGVTAAPGTDNTLKVWVKQLDPGTRYFYRFRGRGGESPIGTFLTAPAQGQREDLKLAFSGDSDILWTDHPDPENTPFAALDRVREEHPDLFVYLGDTVYSDSESGAGPALTRSEKWAKYRDNRIPATKRLLASTSTWALWDDHETINDYDGAQLLSDDPSLMEAGMQAFSDYWPVPRYWPIGTNRTYRKLDWGRDIDLLFLDERTFRTQSADEPTDNPCRDAEGNLDLAPMMPPEDRAELGMEPADPACIAHVLDPDRTMLGARQLAWLKRKLTDDTSRWKLIVNEVPIVQLFVQPYDRWEGYESERRELLRFIDRRNIRGVVFLTTDIHAHIGSPIFVDILAEGAEPVAYEVVTGPVQTCTLDCEVDRLLGFDLAGELMRGFLIDHDLVYNEDGFPHCATMDEYGYALVTTVRDPDRLRVEWRSALPERNGGGRVVEDCPPRQLRR